MHLPTFLLLYLYKQHSKNSEIHKKVVYAYKYNNMFIIAEIYIVTYKDAKIASL